jgi:hypothetical protein
MAAIGRLRADKCNGRLIWPDLFARPFVLQTLCEGMFQDSLIHEMGRNNEEVDSDICVCSGA